MQEWNQPGEEYFHKNVEYAEPASEYFDLAPEYFDEDKKDGKQDTASKAKKNTRKMVYLVAAAVSVAAMGQTLTPQKDKAPVVEQEVENNVDSSYEFEWPKVPGLDGTYGEGTTIGPQESVTGSELYLSAYESFGYSDGGVVPVKQGGVWGLADLKGNYLVEPKYELFWIPPNDNGYTIFKNQDGYYIVGKEGDEYFYDINVSNLRVGDENIVNYTVYDEETGQYRIVYEHLGGSIIYEATGSDFDMDLAMSNTFRNGKAYMTRYYYEGERSYLKTEEISANGSVRVLQDEKEIEEEWRRENNNYQTVVAFSIYGAMDGLSDGYFVGTVPGMGGGIHLVDVSTGKGTGRMVYAVIPEYGIGINDYFSLKYYRDNGSDMMHYKNFGCATISEEYGGTGKDILFDFYDCQDDDALKTCLACHDEIIFDDFDYMVARDGEDYFYIDLNGKIVSESYVCATPFNGNGYALVLDNTQTAYVIDRDFQVVNTMHGVDEIAMNNELLAVHYAEGNEDQKKSGDYGFYYGE